MFRRYWSLITDWYRVWKYTRGQKIEFEYFRVLQKIVADILPEVIYYGVRGEGAENCYAGNPRLSPWAIANQLRNRFSGSARQAVLYVGRSRKTLWQEVYAEVRRECKTYELRLQKYRED